MPLTGTDLFYGLAGLGIVILAGYVRSRRRARMTPEERAADTIAYELRQTRREARLRRR